MLSTVFVKYNDISTRLTGTKLKRIFYSCLIRHIFMLVNQTLLYSLANIFFRRVISKFSIYVITDLSVWNYNYFLLCHVHDLLV